MLDCTELVTHCHKVYDANTRQNKIVTALIENVSWFREERCVQSDKQVSTTDIVKVRIPLIKRDDVPQIAKGDILIHGKAEIEGLTLGELRNEYPDSMEVQSVTYNTHSNSYSRHIRCSGI
ncbi:DUF6751 family protein [Amedibacillus dolichus]|uniref:DUF6751 family protein n=1 Tax=Amedibacillus dolichus TaxID=31971 RepID=UPI00058B2285|nr:DUF6751 family protein [Amedibacillus dolichus]